MISLWVVQWQFSNSGFEKSGELAGSATHTLTQAAIRLHRKVVNANFDEDDFIRTWYIENPAK